MTKLVYLRVQNSFLLNASLPDERLRSESVIPATAALLWPESMMIHMPFQLFSPICRANPYERLQFSCLVLLFGPVPLISHCEYLSQRCY